MPAPPDRYAASTFDRYAPQTPSQAAALEAARRFASGVVAHVTGGGFLRRRPPLPSRGLYLVGPVGTGKTHLMAAVHHALAAAGVRATWWSSAAFFRTTETPEAFADAVAAEATVLCLDEVEVDDPANEVRLVRTLKALDARDVVLVATSNVTPEKFVGVAFGGDRFRRFLDEFASVYTVVVVGGEDFRRTQPKAGRAWVGPLPAATARMQAAFEDDPREGLWVGYEAFLRMARDLHPDVLVQRLTDAETLWLDGLAPDSLDDAIRLLRLLDALYTLPDPPILHYTAEAPPEAWLPAEAQHGALAEGIAEKFKRTVSRLNALAAVERVGWEV